ncbi:MAG: sugar ABC transporter permease [Propionibacteriaceae bacterium]|nr:sugar ABC transporter permease [Propionibacteriaceae bacterium]
MTTLPEIRPTRRFRGASINLMYVPALVLFAVFLIWPVIQGLSLSFTNWDGMAPSYVNIGLANYQRLLEDPNFATAMLNTFIFGVGSTIIQQVMGLFLAVLLDRTSRVTNAVRSIIYLPVLISPVVMGAFYYLVFRYNQGALNDALAAFGVAPVSWLSNSGFAIGVIVFINSLQFVGISMIIYLAGLQGIPAEVNEASALDGATGWTQFRYVTWPMLHPAFAASVVINLIGGMKIFDLVRVLTGGGPGYATNSVSTLISRTYFGDQAAGYAAAQGVVLFLVIVIFTVVTNAWLDRRATKLGM